MVFFSFGWTPLQGLYPAEVLAYENRAKGLALQGWCTSAASLINTFGMPIALRDIGYISKPGLLHGAIVADPRLLHFLRLGCGRCSGNLLVCRRDQAGKYSQHKEVQF